MKIVNFGSGSKGNCTLVAGNNFCIMIDAGLPIKEIEEKLWENVDKLSPKKKTVKAKPVAAKPAAKAEKSSNIDVLVED